jgi:hypothetical protein
MGTRITGMDEWLNALKTLPARAPEKFKAVMGQGGNNIKKDWSARWTAMPHEHLPHLVKLSSFQYEVTQHGNTYSVDVGVKGHGLQTRLASFIEYGTLTSRPHPGGQPALEAEAPRTAEWAQKAAEDLLDGAK